MQPYVSAGVGLPLGYFIIPSIPWTSLALGAVGRGGNLDLTWRSRQMHPGLHFLNTLEVAIYY